MACLLTSGNNDQGCKTGGAGIKRVLITEYVNKNTATITAGVVTAMALDTTTQFREYVLHNENPGMWQDDLTVENGNYFYQKVIDFDVRTLSVAVRNEILLIAQNTVMMIVERFDGTYNLFGYNNGMDLKTGAATSGTAPNDYKGNKLHFEGKDLVPAYEVSSGIIAALLLPAA